MFVPIPSRYIDRQTVSSLGAWCEDASISVYSVFRGSIFGQCSESPVINQIRNAFGVLILVRQVVKDRSCG